MKTVFATFNFRNTDLATADRLYLENHVQLTLQIPNLRQYIMGVIRPYSRYQLPHRAAFNYFDDTSAMQWALHRSPAAKALLRDGAAHLRVNRWLELDSEIVVPFESRRAGLKCFVLAAEFELNLKGNDVEAAEKHYMDYHVDQAKRLPNLRHYMISKYQMRGKMKTGMTAEGARSTAPNPLRMAMLVFDSFESLRDAYNSPVGQELEEEEKATITTSRVYRIDATVQL